MSAFRWLGWPPVQQHKHSAAGRPVMWHQSKRPPKTLYIFYPHLIIAANLANKGACDSVVTDNFVRLPNVCIITARSELREVLFLAPSVCFFVFVWNISRTAERICAKFTRKTYLVPRSDKFEGQGQRSKVKVTRDKKQHFSALLAACVRFMFGKTSLASS